VTRQNLANEKDTNNQGLIQVKISKEEFLLVGNSLAIICKYF